MGGHEWYNLSSFKVRIRFPFEAGYGRQSTMFMGYMANRMPKAAPFKNDEHFLK